MPLEITRSIEKFPPERGGYHFIRLQADEINRFSKKAKTRLIALFDGEFALRCGLNPLGGGEFFIMLAKEKMEKIGRLAGERIHIEITEDPDPLGVEIPSFLLDLLADNPVLEAKFQKLTDGGKRTLIFTLIRMKDRDSQIEKAVSILSKT